jgi:hypothetical protein
MLQMSPASLLMSRRLLPAAAVLAAVLVAACGGDSLTDPSSPRPSRRLLRGAELAAVTLVSCPASESELDALGIVGVWGGEIEGDEITVQVPSAAVDEITGITVHMPASPYLEVNFNANGYEHYTFDVPITVSIDYSRCPDSAIQSHAALRVVYLDDATRQPIEDMGGIVDSVARTITFQTRHFSSYAVSE